MIRLLMVCVVLLATLSAKMVVSVSVIPQAFFVNKIAGDLVDVNVMVSQGKSPEMYEPSIKQVKELSKSSAYFFIGMPFESAWRDRFIGVNPDMKIVEPLKEGVLDDYLTQYPKNIIFHKHSVVSHIGHYHDNMPHIWLSFILSAEHAKVIAHTLQEIDPDNSDVYEHNLQELLASIDDLFLQSKRYFKNSDKKIFLVYHPAFGYMAGELGLMEISMEQDGKELRILHMKDTLDLIKKHNINSILVQPQFSTKSAEIIAKEANLNIEVADPLRYDWLDNMRDIVRTIYSH